MYIIDEKKLLNKENLVRVVFRSKIITFCFSAVPIVLEKSPVEYLKDEHKYPTTH